MSAPNDECIAGHKVHQADGQGGMRGRDERGKWEDCAEVEAPKAEEDCHVSAFEHAFPATSDTLASRVGAIATEARQAAERGTFRQRWITGLEQPPEARPSWDDWLDGFARHAATRGNCRRRKVGAVIVSPDNRVLGVGYNGAMPSMPGCLAGACPRGRQGYDAVPASSSYDSTEEGACIAIHAEDNALQNARWPGCTEQEFLRYLAGAHLRVTAECCPRCRALYAAVGITDIRVCV